MISHPEGIDEGVPVVVCQVTLGIELTEELVGLIGFGLIGFERPELAISEEPIELGGSEGSAELPGSEGSAELPGSERQVAALRRSDLEKIVITMNLISLLSAHRLNIRNLIVSTSHFFEANTPK